MRYVRTLNGRDLRLVRDAPEQRRHVFCYVQGTARTPLMPLADLEPKGLVIKMALKFKAKDAMYRSVRNMLLLAHEQIHACKLYCFRISARIRIVI